MEVTIKTLSSGTYNGNLPGYDAIKAISDRLAQCSGKWMWFELSTKDGLVLINVATIVSIKEKK